MCRMPNFEGILKHMSMMSMSAPRLDTPDGRDYWGARTVQA